MRKVWKHLRTCVFRGLLAVIPLVLSYFVVKFIYVMVDQRVARLLERLTGIRIPGLGVLLVLLILYLLGLAASNWAGRWVLGLIEKASARIPLIKTIYSLGKQLAMALSLPEKQAFHKVVLVEHFRPGLWSIGFVTGRIADRASGKTLLKIFIPTAPNPTTGFSVMIRAEEVREVPWTVSEAMNAVISGGIIGPEEIPAPPDQPEGRP